MKLTDDILQQYFDGELPALETETVRRALENAPDAQARLTSLGTLRTVLVEAAADVRLPITSDDLYARISRQIAEEKASGRHESFEVIEGEAATTSHARGLARAPQTSSVGRIWWVTAAAVVTLAALPALNAWLRGDETPQAIGGPVAVVAPSTAPVNPPTAAPAPPPGTQVIEVEFGPGSTGTVFAVEGEPGQAVAVVWINDEGE